MSCPEIKTASRMQNTKRNIIFSYIDTVITLLFGFLSRTIITHIFGEQYLGLSSLFTSILQVLNMADLGFAGAIVYNMYRPIAENDIISINALLNYYRTIYRRVAVIIAVVGVMILPFLHLIIKDGYPQNVNLHLLYLLYLTNTICSYLFYAYYSALLQALQRLDLTKIGFSIVNIFQSILQIVCILLLKNYYYFVVISIIGVIVRNLFVARIAQKSYPQFQCKGVITKETREDIIFRVKGLFIGSVSSITYTTFDSIILSACLGLTSVAIYNNYFLIYNAVNQFVVMIRNSMQASVGNSIAKETIQKNYNDLFLWQFLYSVIAVWASSCMISLYQPVMRIWMGERLLLPFINVIFIASLLLVGTVQHAFFLFLGGNGFWWEMRWPYVFSTITNIILNVTLGKIFGICGIIFSTFIVTFLFGNLWQCNIVFKYYFKCSSRKYHLKQLKYYITAGVSWTLSYYINSKIPWDSIFGVLIKLIICTIVSISVIYILYRKTSEYRAAYELTKRVIRLHE